MAATVCVACRMFFLRMVGWIEDEDGMELRRGYRSLGMRSAAMATILLPTCLHDGVPAVAWTFFLLYLLTTAYIDGRTMRVYTLPNRVALVVGVVLHIHLAVSCGPWEGAHHYTAIIFYTAIIEVQCKMKAFGEGDGDVFLIGMTYLAYLFSEVGSIEKDWLSIFLLQSALSVLIFLFIHFRQVDWKRMKVKERRAFVPSIYVANLILCLWSGIS